MQGLRVWVSGLCYYKYFGIVYIQHLPFTHFSVKGLTYPGHLYVSVYLGPASWLLHPSSRRQEKIACLYTCDSVELAHDRCEWEKRIYVLNPKSLEWRLSCCYTCDLTGHMVLMWERERERILHVRKQQKCEGECIKHGNEISSQLREVWEYRL